MGCGASKEEVDASILQRDQVRQQWWQHEKAVLKELDSRTRVGHLLIELRYLGFVEIQGKDIGGIYQRLDEWLKRNWRAQRATHDIAEVAVEVSCCGWREGTTVQELKPHDELCDASYTLGQMTQDGRVSSNGVFKARGSEGENNMGKVTMQLVSFMTNECGWTLQVCDAGNNGFYGQIREQQIKFKSPHPLNLIAPHIMIELRSIGYIEINGPNTNGIHEALAGWLRQHWGASRTQADPDYCDLKFSCSRFKKRGTEGENNMGQLTMELVDFMVKQCAWTMITCNAGNFGRKGDKREQQLVFRNDEHVQHGENHMMIELRSSGYVEVNGLHDVGDDFCQNLDAFMKGNWRCDDYEPGFWEGSEKYCDKKYKCPDSFYYRHQLANNLGKRSIEVADFLGQHGWGLLLCNGGSITPSPQHNPNFVIREQQLKFTKTKMGEARLPLLMIEFRTQPTGIFPPRFDGFIEINGKDVGGIYRAVTDFITQHMQGRYMGRPHYCDANFSCAAFRLKEHQTNFNRWDGRLNGESNIGKWTMRLVDFIVDHIGTWDMIACNSDNVDWNYKITKDDFSSVTGREMQLVFRHRPGGGRGVFMSATSSIQPLGRAPQQPPQYWKQQTKQGEAGQEVVPGTAEELRWIQDILDGTFKQKATRDRKEALASRFVAVACLRSEHPELWDKFATRRKEVQVLRRDPSEIVEPKTAAACPSLAERCAYRGRNPTGQAFLLHGTSPTSAVSILGTSFKVDFAGKSAGTMFGSGIYLAEASSKADEYARDDASGEYKGLYAVLLCRAVVGRPFVVEKPGDYAKKVTSGEYDCVLGDREKAVGTYREFIFFHEGSVYPEYAAFYRREYAPAAVAPSRMTMDSTPTVPAAMPAGTDCAQCFSGFVPVNQTKTNK